MGKILTIKELKEIIPFTHPFLLIDRAELFDDKVCALKNLTMNEEFFQGHFPSSPIMPGVLQVEAMVQAAVILLADKCQSVKNAPFITNLTGVKFRKPVIPGDQLVLNVKLDEIVNNAITVSANATVNGQVASEAKFTLRCTSSLTESPNPVTLTTKIPTEYLPAEDILEKETPVTDIMKIIPHRYPFLLVDKLIGFNSERKEIIGVKNVSYNEPFFAGSTAAQPIVPNSIQMEIAAQLGCYYMLTLPENVGKIGYFMAIDDAVFHRPVLPGDQMIVYASLNGSKGRFGKGYVKIFVNDKIVSEGTLKFVIG